MTLDQLKSITSAASQELLDALQGAFDIYNINTPERQACFLAQCIHESTGFTRFEESLYYSAPRLLEVFPSYFTPSQAADYAKQPERIANRVYANRMGNGLESSGDGWKYRGRGAIGITGKDMYTRCGASLNQDFVNNPDLVKSLEWAIKSAAWVFCEDKKCLFLADKMQVKQISKRINGGYLGLQERIDLTTKIYGILK